MLGSAYVSMPDERVCHVIGGCSRLTTGLDPATPFSRPAMPANLSSAHPLPAPLRLTATLDPN